MAYLNSCTELDDLGKGAFRSIHHLRPVAYLKSGSLRAIPTALAASADVALPLGADGAILFKFDPSRPGVWAVQSPDRKASAQFSLVGATGIGALATKANEYVFPEIVAGADLVFSYGGHFVSADFRLKKGHPKVISWSLDAQTGFDAKTLTLGDLLIRPPVLLPPDAQIASVPLAWKVVSDKDKYRLDCALPDGDWAGWTLDPTLTLQPDAAAGEDVRLLAAWFVARNYGIGAVLSAGRFGDNANVHRTLIRFNVGAIPAAATITAATMSVYIQDDTHTYEGTTVDCYEVAAANGDWIEGTKDNATAGAGEPCWNAKEANGSGGVTTAWAGSAGLSTAGTDYVNTKVGTFTVPNPDALNDAMSTPLTAAVVQGWMTSNPGLLLRATTESGSDNGFSVYSSDHATASYRPKLVVDYTLPASGGGMLLLGVG